MERFKILDNSGRCLKNTYWRLRRDMENVQNRVNKALEGNIPTSNEQEFCLLFSEIESLYMEWAQVLASIESIKNNSDFDSIPIYIRDNLISDALTLYRLNKLNESIALLEKIEGFDPDTDLIKFENQSITDEDEAKLLKLWMVGQGSIDAAKNQKVIRVVEYLFDCLAGGYENISSDDCERYKNILRKILFNYWKLVSYSDEDYANAEKNRRKNYWELLGVITSGENVK